MDQLKLKRLNENRYVFALVDDFLVSLGFSFWSIKIKLFHILRFFKKGLKKKKRFLILRIKSYRGGEFVNQFFLTYCDDNGIKHEMSCPKTP